ncbi:MAG: hypothetical protein JWM87_737 [Candidatus Eremiobacteraeota bacterium]|nr:hypothetical protein [Candidatus Eremiobacteraeota bacterium]
MATSAAILGFEMLDALHAAFSAEMHAGGKLANLVSLRKTNQLAQNAAVNPSDVVGGIKMHGHGTPRPVGQRVRDVDVPFDIILAARSQKTPAVVGGAGGKIALADDALAALRPVIDDGAGGGVVGVLNNPALFGLPQGGQSLAQSSELGKGDFFEDLQGEGADQSVWVIYAVEYVVVGRYHF